MPFTFRQTNGLFLRPSGVVLAKGYSGHGEGRLNPSMQGTRKVGVLPAGLYRKSGPECTAEMPPIGVCPECGGTGVHRHGPYVIRLTPVSPPSVFGEYHQRLVEAAYRMPLAEILAKPPKPYWWMLGRDGMLVHGDSINHDASEGCIILDPDSRRFFMTDQDYYLSVTL